MSEKKQRVNMDLDKDLWKEVGKLAVELELQKKEIVELALKNFLEKHKNNSLEEKAMKVFYDDILVGEMVTNQSMTVDEALELIDFDEEKFIVDNGFDDINYGDFKLVY
jgi:metal-responsive CopG/Arc/MetJ family transcriptional regulator